MSSAKAIIVAIKEAVDKFNGTIPAIEQAMYKGVANAIKDLETYPNGDIKVNTKNLKIISEISDKINAIVLSPSYKKSVSQFVGAFDQVGQLQNDYFSSFTAKFAPPTVLKQVSDISIKRTLNSLTEAGLQANMSSKITDILTINTTTGANFTDLLNQVREFTLTTDGGKGALTKYASQITTDSLNQYAATRNNIIAQDLGLDWYTYDGALIKTSRCWCRAMVGKKYIHRTEFQALIDGNFEQFDGLKCTIYQATDLPNGMIEGTNPSNLLTNRGGYGCEHQFTPVSEVLVPKDLRDKF